MFCVKHEDVSYLEQIGQGTNSTTYKAILISDSSEITAKVIMKSLNQINESRLNIYLEELSNTSHNGLAPFIGYCEVNEITQEPLVLLMKSNCSITLKNILSRQMEGESPKWWDITRQFIVILGISKTLEYLHSNNVLHRRLTPSNILLNKSLEPIISDFDFSSIFVDKIELSPLYLQKENLLYYIDPDTLKNGNQTIKSDIYSFGIIMLQILLGTCHIYENEDDPEQLVKQIKEGLMPNIPSNFPILVQKLIQECLNKDPIMRPPFRSITKKISDIIQSLPEVSKEVIDEYIFKLENTADFLSPEIEEFKKLADEGDIESMYFYACARNTGKGCTKNVSEATRYFKTANRRGYKPAERQLSIQRYKSGSIVDSDSIEDIKSNQKVQNQNEYDIINKKKNTKKNEFLRLADDPFFDEDQCDMGEIINEVQEKINKEDRIAFNREELEKENFIFTEGAEERLNKLYNYIKVGVPVLLEGPTGTSKTLSSEVVCKLLGKELIRLNLSSETKTQDFIGRYAGDENSWSGISQKDGPFIRAYRDGKILLLDEINLASSSVLQCIEEALDSGVLSIEIPGRPFQVIEMNPDFRLIATQNPNKGSYAHKRQNLGLKFYSRFQVINFPAFSEIELLNIGQGLSKRFGYDNMNVIQQLVKFHKEWSENPDLVDDPQCFTVREIAAAVKAFSQKESINDTIMTIYGARYQKETKQKMISILKKYNFLQQESEITKIPEFEGCFKNQSLNAAVKATLFSLKNGRNVILTGREGCGKTQVALWISEFYNKNINEDGDEHSFCICTEDTKVADLVGHQAPSGKSDGTSELIKWQDGFLTKAIKQGKCSVLESLDEAPATVTERLNGLLDLKYDNHDKYFDIPENPINPKILIEKTFRILATCNIEKLSQMSPAFLNRFDIIVLEDQISENVKENELEDLISTLLIRFGKSLKIKQQIIENISQHMQIENSSDDSELDWEDESDDESEGNNNIEETKKQDQRIISTTEYTPTNSLIKYILSVIGKETNISKIAKICNSFVKLYTVFPNNNIVSENEIVDFVVELLKNYNDFIVPEHIKQFLLSLFKEISQNTDDTFFYKDSLLLCNFMAKMMAYSIIEQPICVSGETGAGKTSAARAFSRMRPSLSKSKIGFLMHSFHSGTKTAHFFGSTTLSEGNIIFHDGTLTSSMKNGFVFIADEFNLSSQSVMKSIAPALEPSIGKNIYIPGAGQNIVVSPEFHFIACQNELGTIGRNAIPESISQRFVYINYPKPEIEDIQKISISISTEYFPPTSAFKQKDEELANQIGSYMIMLNQTKISAIPKWSLRDIIKIFRRIHSPVIGQRARGITPIHQIYFYTMSMVPSDETESVIKHLKFILKSSFDLQDEELEALINSYTAEPEILEIENEGFFIMKGSQCGIPIDNKPHIINNRLPSLWNSFFLVSLADEREPILLMGNSGYKTFLAKQFIPKAQDITLNQETSVAQLLGTSGFLTKSEAKLFYINYLCRISQNTHKYSELKNSWEKGELKKEDILLIAIEGKKAVPFSFHYAIDHLVEKLFNNCEENSGCVLSNTTLEFRPGLFLNAILQGESLILKDLSNLPTIVLERFNELFSGKQNITLSEDIHNTFTSSESKELTDFNDSFRVFATCPANSPSKLSEAVLSRFTVISVPEYKQNEQIFVLNSYIQLFNLTFDKEYIDRLTQFAKSFNERVKRIFSFPQMIKIIEITSALNKATTIEKQNINIVLAIYRYCGGLIESSKGRDTLSSLIKDYFTELPEQLFGKKDNEKCPFIVQIQDNLNGIESSISGLFLASSSVKIMDNEKVAFTQTFCDLLDIIHMAMVIHFPIIIEGLPGQGKHTAINYIAKMLDMEIVHIMISESTKCEDLFGRDTISRRDDGIHVEMLETKFVKIIKSGSFEDKSLLVLENINNASPAVLNALVPVFNTNHTSILMPNGSTIQKGKFNIIGIFNSQNASSSKDKLPSSLINSAIYHILIKPRKDEIFSVILTKFIEGNLSQEEAGNFYHNFIKAKKIISKEGNSSEILTLNDLEKYILFRNLTVNFFDESTISQIIFAYRFSSDEMIQNILKSLNLENMKFCPLFNYTPPPQNLYIRMSKDSPTGLVIPVLNELKDPNKIYQIDSLTLPQKHCLIFMACSLLSKRSCVIQGDTASGKSYLVRLFAEILGAKLNVFQMNSDSSITMLAGQSVLNNNISEEDVLKFKKALAELSVDPKIQQFLENNDNIDIQHPNAWNPYTFKKLLNFIDGIEEDISMSIKKDNIASAVKIIKETMSPVNRFCHQESAFIHALRNGEWVLFDGIESAPSEISEKISSLCGESPEINLYEYGPDFYFSKDAPLENKIHENFHLFITYNPNYMKEAKVIDQSFLIKSVSFTLPQIDSRIEYSAQMLLGSLTNLSYPSNLSVELGARLASMHEYAKTESQKRPDFFAGDIQYNGRTLKFVTKAFQSHMKNKKEKISESKELPKNSIKKKIYQPVCFSTKSFYWNTYIDQGTSEKFKKSMLQKLFEKPKAELINSLQTSNMTQKERNQKALLILRNLQNFILKRIPETIFSFTLFLNSCSLIRISDIAFVLQHLNDTMNLISINTETYHDKQHNPLKIFGLIKAIIEIFNDIKKPSEPIKVEHSFLCLNEKELRNNLSIVLPLSKFDLLLELTNCGLFSKEASTLLGRNIYLEAINIISSLIANKTKKIFLSLLKIISENKIIDFVESIFPYRIFKDSNMKMISYWIPLIKKLITNGICLSITVDDEEIIFNKSQISSFAVNLIMKENDCLSLSKDSKISFSNKNNYHIKEHPPNENEMNDLKFYQIAHILSKDPNQKINKKKINEILKNVKNQCENKEIQSPKFNIIASIKEFFVDQAPSLISLIWSIVPLFNQEVISEISSIVHPIESELLRSASAMYAAIRPDSLHNVIEWTKWASIFENSAPTLMKLVVGISDKNKKLTIAQIDEHIYQMNKEISYLKRSSGKVEEYWSSDSYVKDIETELSEFKSLKERSEMLTKELEIKREITKLKEKLINTKIKEKFVSMKSEIINKLGSVTDFTENRLEIARKYVDQFIYNANQSDIIKSISISWPSVIYKKQKNDLPTENIKIFNEIIWYSEVKTILEEIFAGNNIIKNLMQLILYPEMNASRELMLSNYIQNSKDERSGLSLFDKDNAIYTLNAYMIYKLARINICFIKDPTSICSILNKFKNRSFCDDREIAWAFEKVTNMPENFKIVLPRFEPNDLVCLIANKKSETDVIYGPLIHEAKNKVFIEDIVQLMHQEYNSFKDSANAIAKIAFRTFVSQDKPPNDIGFLKDALMKKCDHCKQIDHPFIKGVLNVIILSEYLDGWDNNRDQLLFDDLTFLNGKWVNDVNLLNQYPSLVFWLFKNKKCSEQICRKYHDISLENDKLPLWLHCFRIMSSFNCITFDSVKINDNSSTIRNSVTSTILLFLSNRSKKNENIGYKWINLLLSNLPLSVSDANIKIIHDFFYSLTLDEQKYPSKVINDQKLKCVFNSIEEITNQVLLTNQPDLVNQEIKKYDTIQFLVQPSQYIQKQIDDSLSKSCRIILESDAIINLKAFLNSQNALGEYKKSIENAINSDLAKEKDEIDLFSEGINEKNRNRRIKYFRKIITEYNYIATKLENLKEKLTWRKTNELITELIKYKKDIDLFSDLYDANQEPISFIGIKFKSSFDFVINVFQSDGCYHKLELFKSNEIKIIYLRPIKFLFNDMKKNTFESKKKIYPQVEYIENKLQRIKENPDLEGIINSENNYITNYPTLFFGKNKISSKCYLKNIDNLQQSILCYEKRFFEKLENGTVGFDTFKIIDESLNYISELKNNSSVEFSNNHMVQYTNEALQELKKYLYQISQYIQNVKNITEKELKPLWQALNQQLKYSKLFDFNYDVPDFSQINSKMDFPNFSQISNVNSLASPIISISPENKIVCCVKKLQSQFRPIISSHFSKPIIVNIISFIDQTFFCSIENMLNQQNKIYISTKEKYQANELIQIIISYPDVSENEPVNLVLKGDLKIVVPSFDSFLLPFEFSLLLIPLKLRINCKQYSLAKEEDHLRLCCDKVFSGSKIDFEVQNYYISDYFVCIVELESLEENDSPKPIIIPNKSLHSFSINFPKVEEPKRSKFLVRVAFSQLLVLVISCDFVLVPITFSFEVYDYFQRKYVQNECQIYYEENIRQILRFRLISPGFPEEKEGKLFFNFPTGLKIIKSDVKLLDGNIKIPGNCYNFSIEIEIFNSREIPKSYKYSRNYSKYESSFEIDGYKKVISFNFKDSTEIPTQDTFGCLNFKEQFLSTNPCFIYSNETKDWERIRSNSEIQKILSEDLPMILVTPFSYYSNKDRFIQIKYERCLREKNNQYVTISYSHKTVKYFQICAEGSTNVNDKCDKHEESDYNIFKFIRNSTSKKYYSVLGYLENNNKVWFPTFVKYPDSKNIKKLTYDDASIEEAKNNINFMYNNVDVKNPSLSEINKDCLRTNLSLNNFAVLMILLEQKEVIIKINQILAELPKEINDEYRLLIKEEIDKIEEKFYIVYSHNAILAFAKIFKLKYDEIRSHQDILEFPLTISEINNQIKKALNQFMEYDTAKDKEIELYSSSFNAFSKYKKKLEQFEIVLPESKNQFECFIVSEKGNLMPTKLGDDLSIYELQETPTDIEIFSDSADNITSLPAIEIPQKITISNLCMFYAACNQGSSILPMYIRSLQIKKKNQEESQKYFAELLSIYRLVTKDSTHDRSILAYYINSFIDSFKSTYSRLKTAGVNFNSIDIPQNCLVNVKAGDQDFIRYPDIEIPYLNHTEWKTKDSALNSFSHYNEPTFNKGRFEISINKPSPQSDEFLFNISNETKGMNETTFSNHQNDSTLPISGNEKRAIIAKVIADEASGNSSDSYDDNDDLPERNENAENDSGIPKISLKSNASETIIQSDDFDGIFSNFDEIDGIERVVRRIKEMDKNGKIKFFDSNNESLLFDSKKELFITSSTDFSVKDLLEKCWYLIANLISSASDSSCPFLDISCNLLIDCSSFICEEIKLYNFMIMVSFSYALAALEIPFSIAIIADQRFRFILKPFEEEISIVVLQRILDCLFIKRYRTNIADTFRHAIEYMKHPNKNQRAFFIFSDGLDENLIIPNSWKESILNCENNSFGMIFTKSKLLLDKNLDIILKMWDDFNDEVKSAKSTTKLAHINPDINDSTFKLIVDVFAQVLSRKQTSTILQPINMHIDKKPILLMKCNDLSAEAYESICNDIYYKFDEIEPQIFRQVNQRSSVIGNKFERLDISYYRNKTSKITSSSVNPLIKENFIQLIHNIVSSKKNNYRQLLETIFKPNKASQTVLSSTGTDFDITALVLNLINPTPDPLIYLEEKGGLVKNYGISIIIDSSISCFNQLSSMHSIQTIKTLFSALSLVDVPFIDVIVATDDAPIVLCSEIQSLRAFNDKSTLWSSLFSCLSENKNTCDLESAIHAAFDIRRMRSSESTSYLFVLTDGLFHSSQKERLRGHIASCIQNGINSIGIGIGIYPNGIIDIFPQAVYSPNPSFLIHAIAACFGEEPNDSLNSIQPLMPTKSTFNDIKSTFDKFIKNEKNPIFKDLKHYLNTIPHAMDAFSDMYNDEQEARNSHNELINPDGLNTEMYVKDLLKGQKILIVMLYNCDINIEENAKVHPAYLKKSAIAEQTACVLKAVEHFGIEIVVVENYKEAIQELTKQTNPGKCDYYATWVLSGGPYELLPNNGNPHFVIQFVDCLIQYWQKGGSVVLFAEGYPLFFQANLFLERITFSNNKKTKLQLGGNHKGQKLLYGDPSGKLDQPQTFNKSPLEFKKCLRPSLAHNLVQIYEGETISFVPNDPNVYEPFIPFMRDSENGISALFYPGDQSLETGDIVVDCGYTKLFDKMTENGTFRYIQNIAGWTAQAEFHRASGIQPKSYRPKAITFALDETVKYAGFIKNSSLSSSVEPIDISSLTRLFAIDHSGSVDGVALYHNELSSIFSRYYKNGDTIMTWGSIAQIISYQRMMSIIASREGNEDTCPNLIAEACANNSGIPREHLILVTDGNVRSGSIKRSDEILKQYGIQFKFVTTYVIGSGGDLSVGAPYARNCESVTIVIDSNGSRREILGSSQADLSIFDQLGSISNEKQFTTHFNSLFRATKVKMMGRGGDANIQSQFEDMKRRISASGTSNADIDRKMRVLIKMASGSIQNVFDDSTITAMYKNS